MKKQLLIGSMLALSTILSACSNDKSNQLYEEAMANGKSSVIEEEYYEAIDDFRSALEYKEGDTEAEKLIEQLELLLDAKKAKEDNVYSGVILLQLMMMLLRRRLMSIKMKQRLLQ